MSEPTIAAVVAETDRALEQVDGLLADLQDGDLHRAHRDGGWTVAQVLSHINVCALLWVADLTRLRVDPDLDFIFREEVGHDALGYPPPTVAQARGQIASTRRTLRTTAPAEDDPVLERTVEIPDLGTLSVRAWSPLILGHLGGHVDQLRAILTDRGVLPGGA